MPPPGGRQLINLDVGRFNVLSPADITYSSASPDSGATEGNCKLVNSNLLRSETAVLAHLSQTSCTTIVTASVRDANVSGCSALKRREAGPSACSSAVGRSAENQKIAPLPASSGRPLYFRHLGRSIGAVSHGDGSITYFRTAVLERKGEGRTCNTRQAKTMRLRDETAQKPLCSLVSLVEGSVG